MQREQLDLFRALPGDMAPRDSQDLMAFPFFSLAKSRRTVPIDFRSGEVTVRVEGTLEHGIATIWDADILIWAASQIVEAKDARKRFRHAPKFAPAGHSTQMIVGADAAIDHLVDTRLADFKNADYDRLFEASLKLPHGPARNQLYDAMNKIAVAQQPWIFGDIRMRSTLAHRHVKGLKLHPLLNTSWRYLDLQK